MYCNYAQRHWTLPGENPLVGLILCAGKGRTLAEYALGGLHNKILASDYLTAQPDKTLLEDELRRTREILEAHRQLKGKSEEPEEKKGAARKAKKPPQPKRGK